MQAMSRMSECWPSTHDHIAELPGICRVDVLGEQAATAGEWRPIRISADHRTEIWLHDAKDALVVEFIRFHHAAARIFQRPYHPSQDSRRHLQRGRVLIRRKRARLFD